MKKIFRLAIPAALILAAGYPYDIDTTVYTIADERIVHPVRICILSDLHGSEHGPHMNRLIQTVKGLNPDLVLLPGDLCDEFSSDNNAFDLLDGLRDYPLYYSMGNHELKREDHDLLHERYRLHGVRVLENESECLEIGGTKLEIAGVNCLFDEDYDVDMINGLFRNDAYRIMLFHRPHLIDVFRQIDCQLVVAGHAHGGQWRLPGTHIGLGAPQQGPLPAYTEGIHELEDKKLLISRGLCKTYHYLPRLFNNPEVVSLTLLPKEEK